ncbi:acetyltransferase [Chryseobacterium luquanense]|uniref:Acetyltransferase n=1 Tax=Chryseobacterium luquanense TaxID=2983766 RepID=A0ABT3Y652_9FLAO|nr:acetyltransferase [Chryseobacterium luquanense]MCX8533638.1 acetyltransferase [Chryseobacterium luquanense]
MEKQKKLIIVGLGETAEIAYEYFTYDSPYEVIGFSVNKEFLTENNPYGLPVYPFEELENLFPPSEVDVYVAVSYVQLNRVRKKMFLEAKAKGYTCASYISSKAFVWRNVQVGENVFIFENNVIQHHVKLGDNIILWSGNHIGHRTEIQDHVYISSHVVISGFCVIGESSFLGVNSTFNDNITLGKDNIVGSGSLIVKNSEDGKLLVGSPARPSSKTSYEAFQVSEEYL